MKRKTIRNILWIVAVAAVAVFRHVTVLADFYALHIYPVVSGALSFVAQVVPFSLEEIAVLAFVALLVYFIARRRLVSILKLAAAVYIWFYVGWGLNYSRSGILERVGKKSEAYDREQFREFLYSYSATLDSLYILSQTTDDYDLETGMKDFFSSVPTQYGLAQPRSWQHAKKPLFNWLYSGCAVLGFMGPFFCEFNINSDVLPEEIPSLMAHEYSHLLGVASESEASWWAFQACNAQPCAAVRFSAYYSVLPYVCSNAMGLLDEDEYGAWVGTLDNGIIDMYERSSAYWSEKYFVPLAKVQRFLQNLMLKSNGVHAGTRSYSQVVGLLMTLPQV